MIIALYHRWLRERHLRWLALGIIILAADLLAGAFLVAVAADLWGTAGELWADVKEATP